jgi:hypothetical protein
MNRLLPGRNASGIFSSKEPDGVSSRTRGIATWPVARATDAELGSSSAIGGRECPLWRNADIGLTGVE